MEAGTEYPEHFESEFHLEGKLHVQPMADHSIIMKLTDLQYMMYNGETDHEHETHYIPIGPEVSDLTHPFMIKYDSFGHLMGVTMEETEKMFSKNMKMSIASMFQMNVTEVTHAKHKEAFVNHKEQTIYDEMDMYYNVYPDKKGHIMVEKMMEPFDMDLYKYMFADFIPNNCEAKFEKPMSYDGQIVYTLTKDGDHFMMTNMHSTGGIFIHPFRGQSESQFLYTNITFDLIETVPITTAFTMTKGHFYDGIHFDMYNLHSTFKDGYFERRHIDQDKLIPILETMLMEIVDYMEHDHLTMKTPDIKHGQLINRILRVFQVSEFGTLEKLWTTFSTKTTDKEKKAFKVMEEMMPLIGTHDSMKMIMMLITTHKLKEFDAIHMLTEAPMSMHIMTEEMLAELEPLLHLDSKFSWEMRKSGILAFGTFMNKAFWVTKYYYKNKRAFDMMEKMDHFGDKYMKMMGEMLETATTYKLKMVVMEAMYNTRMESALPYLRKVLTGEWFHDDEYLKLIAMLSMYQMVDDEEMFEMYWPIMTDHKEHTFMRTAAMYLILDRKPKLSRMINMYWYMQDETNHEVYQFFYKYLESLAHSEDPCEMETSMHAKQVLKYTHKPNYYGMTGFNMMDFMDRKYGFGNSF